MRSYTSFFLRKIAVSIFKEHHVLLPLSSLFFLLLSFILPVLDKHGETAYGCRGGYGFMAVWQGVQPMGFDCLFFQWEKVLLSIIVFFLLIIAIFYYFKIYYVYLSGIMFFLELIPFIDLILLLLSIQGFWDGYFSINIGFLTLALALVLLIFSTYNSLVLKKNIVKKSEIL